MNFTKKLIESKVNSELIFEGKLLHVHRDEALLPNGETATREWIKHPGATAVVPVFENGDIMLLHQFRYPPHQIYMEVPAGKLDPGEAPEVTGERELAEEAGVRCEHLEYAGHFYPGIGYSDEVIYVYVAWGLSSIPDKTDDDEFVEAFRVPFRQAMEWVYDETISDGKTIICLVKAWHWWQQNKPFEL